MWKPSNQPNASQAPSEPIRPASAAPAPASSAPETTQPPAAAIRTPQYNNAASADQATIGKSLIIKGEVTGSESLFIDGKVEGSISLSGNRVTIGRNGNVAANITAREIVVLGKVRGNLNASDRVDIRNEGSLTGDVVAQRISIEDGAYFKGGIDIRKPGQSQGQSQKESEPARTTAEPVVAARA